MEKKKANKKNVPKIDLNKIQKNKKILILLIAIIAIIIFCIYKVIVFVKNPTDTFTVQQGKIYQEERAIGYIIREETIVKGSNYKNGMEQIKTEGERVAKGESIFRYYSSGEEKLTSKIKDLDAKIDEAISKETSLPLRDTKALEKQIENQIIELRKENNIQNISKTKKEISNNIVKKAKIAGEYSPAGSYLKKLIDETSKYENQLNEGAEYVKSPISGAVSYKVDGYEEVFTTDDFSKINAKFLEELNLKTGQLVADSKESAKIINNFECYIACVLDSEQAMSAELDQTVKIRLSNHEEIEGTVKYIEKEDNKTVIIFKIDEQVQELVSYRKISFEIIWWSYGGKKIPNTAIEFETKGENQVAYITRTRNGYQDNILIKILKQNDKYSIVDNYTSEELKKLGYTSEEIKSRKTLTLYDEILKNAT